MRRVSRYEVRRARLEQRRNLERKNELAMLIDSAEYADDFGHDGWGRDDEE